MDILGTKNHNCILLLAPNLKLRKKSRSHLIWIFGPKIDVKPSVLFSTLETFPEFQLTTLENVSTVWNCEKLLISDTLYWNTQWKRDQISHIRSLKSDHEKQTAGFDPSLITSPNWWENNKNGAFPTLKVQKKQQFSWWIFSALFFHFRTQ